MGTRPFVTGAADCTSDTGAALLLTTGARVGFACNPMGKRVGGADSGGD